MRHEGSHFSQMIDIMNKLTLISNMKLLPSTSADKRVKRGLAHDTVTGALREE